MKIAICLSGFVKNFNPNSFLQLGNTVDIFCHTWDYCNTDTLKTLQNLKITVESDSEAFKNTNISPQSWLRPMVLRENKIMPLGKAPPDNIYRMYYSMKRCIEMLEKHELENKFRYDLIIRSRYEIVFNTNKIGQHSNEDGRFNINQLNLYPNQILMPLKGFWVGKSVNLPHFGNVRVNDSLFFGNESCRILHKTYDYFKLLKEKYNPHIHPETLLAYMCKEFNLEIILKNFDCNLTR